MKLRITTPLLLVIVALGAMYVASGPRPAEAVTDAEFQTELKALNSNILMSYADWAEDYDTLRMAADAQWMDWSQDACSAPPGLGLGRKDEFHMACLRHDMMWRTLAVIDRGTGRVWNERNRYRADKQIKMDTKEICRIEYDKPLLRDSLFYCTTAAEGYYYSIRNFAGYRLILVGDEDDSVDDPDHDTYDEGMKLMPVTNCNHSENSSNRCLPVHYVERNGNPFVPQNMEIIPTGTSIQLTAVRANLQAKDGPPSTYQPIGLAQNLYKNSGELLVSVEPPFMVGPTRVLDCANQNDYRTLYADTSAYPTGSVDSTLKDTVFYLKACAAAPSSSLENVTMGLRPVQARRTHSGAYEPMVKDKDLRGYPNMNAQPPRARLDPRPDGVISSQDVWHGPLTLTTVSPLTRALVVANPNDDTPLVEVTPTSYDNHCSNGAETNDRFFVNHGDTIRVVMCGVGSGTLELRDPVSGQVVNSYVVELFGPQLPPPPPPEAACSTGLITSTPVTEDDSWSTSDCFSTYRTNSYIDYYHLRLPSSRKVRINLESDADTYLIVYNGTYTGGVPDHENDDYGGNEERDSQLEIDVAGGRTYTIGATTYDEYATDSYTLRVVEIPDTLPVPAVPTGLYSYGGNAIVTLNWNFASHAEGYEVQQWEASAGGWVTLPWRNYSATITGAQATVRGLTNGVTYYHRVRSWNRDHYSNWSGYEWASPTVTLLSPTNLVGWSSSGTVHLDWFDVTNALEYEVQQWDGQYGGWRTLPFLESGHVYSFSIIISGSRATVGNLRSGITYAHRVRAKNGEVYSPWSYHINTRAP